jgi:hypothetical protein
VELAVLEALQAIQVERLGQLALGTVELMEELGVAREPQGLVVDGLGGAGELASELAEGGAHGEGMEDLEEQGGTLEPVGDLEGLA